MKCFTFDVFSKILHEDGKFHHNAGYVHANDLEHAEWIVRNHFVDIKHMQVAPEPIVKGNVFVVDYEKVGKKQLMEFLHKKD